MNYDDIPAQVYNVPKSVFEKYFPEFEANYTGILTLFGQETETEAWRAFEIIYLRKGINGVKHKPNKKYTLKSESESSGDSDSDSGDES